eukprot:CAMPEP_0201723358 /NCGR_PEP_ID=MMETSP0593-20130828/7436_1 /ASSEMBLY_ACC=CAM_ASM_000672 /TAXON_ID=267983 /ORGANISM="Skeletonema japonicum, Strain CCMP2506" /LENGTH=70 /DNA_ID=CAMNT_0048214455 /DNA_START=28 /DNA_END=240 /DNA_ORIENTATION=+
MNPESTTPNYRNFPHAEARKEFSTEGTGDARLDLRAPRKYASTRLATPTGTGATPLSSARLPPKAIPQSL